jgi:DNA-binding transcriptional LysR family regulator
MPSIHHYRAFVAVMEEGSVTAAAHSIGRTQPQVSRLIATLEAELAFELFMRDRRRLFPTARGARFYSEAKRALDGIDNLLVVASEISREGGDVLRILAPTYIAHSFLPAALRELRRRLPGLRFSVEIVARNAIGSWIAFHPFDVGVAALPFDHPGVKVEPFATVSSVVVLPNDHRLCSKRWITGADLAAEPFVALSKNTPLRQRLETIFQAEAIVPRIVVETSSSNSACELVAHGLGITIVDSVVALPRQSQLGLVIKRWRPGLDARFAFIYPTSAGLIGNASAFVEVVKKTVLSTPRGLTEPL